MAATSIKISFDTFLICSQSYPVHVLVSGGSRIQVHLVTLIQLTLRRGESGDVGLRHWKFSGAKISFHFVVTECVTDLGKLKFVMVVWF